MSKEAAQSVASAPTGTEGHNDYLSLKNNTSGAESRESQTTDKAALESDPESNPSGDGQNLTDTEKSQRKQRNDQRRQERWYEERGRIKAEKAELERRLADLEAKGRNDSPSAALKIDGKPTLKAFLESGKFKTYEDALEAFTDAKDEFNRKQWEGEQSKKDVSKEESSVRSAFQTDVKEFSKTHDDFNDVFDSVRDTLDTSEGQGTPLTNALLRSKNPAQLIYHIGQTDDALAELAELSEAGDWQGAIEALGAIKRELKAQSSKAPEKDTTIPTTPKPPKHVRGAGEVPDVQTAQRQAVDKNDFSAWQKLERQRKAKG